MTFDDLTAKHAVVAPVSELKLELVVDIGPRMDLGEGPLGHRFMIPILGGEFKGPDGLEGDVLAGGADRQLMRRDGILELAALYEIKTADGVVITVDNRVKIDTTSRETPPRSTVTFSAPDGAYGWLNRRTFVGTLNPLAPDRTAVLIRVFQQN